MIHILPWPHQVNYPHQQNSLIPILISHVRSENLLKPPGVWQKEVISRDLANGIIAAVLLLICLKFNFNSGYSNHVQGEL